LALFRSAIALQYSTPQAWYGLARIFLETGDLRGARTAWGILSMFDAKLAMLLAPAFLQTW